jgi:hypothetical protein
MTPQEARQILGAAGYHVETREERDARKAAERQAQLIAGALTVLASIGVRVFPPEDNQ